MGPNNAFESFAERHSAIHSVFRWYRYMQRSDRGRRGTGTFPRSMPGGAWMGPKHAFLCSRCLLLG